MHHSTPRNTASRLRGVLLAGSALSTVVLALSGTAFANPVDGTFGGGTGTITGCNGATSCTIDLNDPRVIIDWKSFNIAEGEKTTFQFGKNDWIVFNRVAQGSSQIEGALRGCLDANCAAYGGNIWIYSADGFVIGEKAKINTGGLLLTTSPLTSTPGFLGGDSKFDFGNSSTAAAILVRDGARITGHGGTIALIAQQLKTEDGSAITMESSGNDDGKHDASSSVLYGAASSYRVHFVDQAGDFDLVDFEVPAASAGSAVAAGIDIQGQTKSAGNIYVATAVNPAQTAGAIINISGVMTANTVSSRGGNIVLSAGGGIMSGHAQPSIGAPVDVAVGGTLNADDTVQIRASGSIAATGAISAGTLTGSAAGAADFSNASNRIAKLDGFTSEGFNLADGRSLTVTGGVDAGAHDLTLGIAGDLTLGANLRTQQTASLTASGRISQQAGAVIAADRLTGSSGGVTSLAGGNRIDTLAGFSSGGNFSLTNDKALAITGVLDASGHRVSLDVKGDIDASGAVIKAAKLTGSAKGSADFSNADNMIAELAGFRSHGDFSLTDGMGLTISHALNAAGHKVTLTVDGVIDASRGAITAASLTGSANGLADFGNASNRIQQLDGFRSDGFKLTDARSLIVAGAVDAGAGDLALDIGGDLIVNADLTTGATATLIAKGRIDASRGRIVADTLTGSSQGDADFGNAGNSIDTLAGFTSGGDFTLVDMKTLTIAGTLDASGHQVMLKVNGNIDASQGIIEAGILTGSAAGSAIFSNSRNMIATLADFTSGDFTLSDGRTLTIAGTLDASEHKVRFDVDGDIRAGEGIIKAASLSGSATGSADFGNESNHIEQLDGFRSQGFKLGDARALIVAGSVDAGAGNLILNVDGDLTVKADLITGATASLTAAGSIDASGGRIVAHVLTGSSAHRADFGNAGNMIGTLGDFTSGGDFTLSDGRALTIAGTLNASGHKVRFDVNGDIQAREGIIKAASLSGSASGFADFSNESNRIKRLGGFHSEGFKLADARSLIVTGDVDAGASNLVLDIGGDLTVNANLKTDATAMLDAMGNIDANGGAIVADKLTGSSGGDAMFSNAGNTIDTLDGFTSGGNFTLRDGVTLVITGALDVADTVTLDVEGGIDASHGAIDAAILTGSATGAADFSGASNHIVQLDSFSANGFKLNDARSLTVVGDVDAGAGDLSLGVGGDLIVNADLTTHGTAMLTALGIIDAGGKIDAEILTGSATGAAIFNADNSILKLGSFRSAGFKLTDAQSLIVDGAVDAGMGDLVLDVGGNLTVNAGLTTGATASLKAAGSIDAAYSRIVAKSLTGSSKGGADFGNAGNTIGTLAGFTSGGDFTLRDATALAITGTLDAAHHRVTLDVAGGIQAHDGIIDAAVLTGSAQGSADFSNAGNRIDALADFASKGDFSLRDATTLTIAGALDASGHAVTLDVDGNIEANGGSINAASLTGSATGPADFGNMANAIGTLGRFTAGSGFTLVNSAQLTVAGDVDAGTGDLAITTRSGDLVLEASLLAGPASGSQTVALDAQEGAILQTGGRIESANVGLAAATSIDLEGGNSGVASIAGNAVTLDAGGSIFLRDNGTDNSAARFISGKTVVLDAADSIFMGSQAFIGGAQDAASPAVLTAYLNNEALQPGNGTIFVAAHELHISASGRIVQQNTGSSISDPGGIAIEHDASSSPQAILISGNPVTVDLWGALVENGTAIPVHQVAWSSAVRFDDDTQPSNSYRINGCVVQQTGLCTVLQFTFDPIEPARMTEELLLKASDDDEGAGEDDPTITGSGNPEIWGE